MRHARPAVEGVFLGRTDPSLANDAEAESRERLTRIQVEVVYSSPLRRARSTAAWLHCDAPVIVLPDLADLDFGEWQGLSWSEIVQRDPERAEAKLADWLGIAPPGGESWLVFERRVSLALRQVVAGPFPAAVVAHEAVNAVIALQLTGVPPGQFHQPFGAAIRINLRSSGPVREASSRESSQTDTLGKGRP